MGNFRTVFCQMTCEQCGKDHRAEVQFKTDEDWQEVYENSQKISEDAGLAPGRSFAGCVDRFCPDCHRRWRADHESETLDVLARYVDQGRLAIQSKGAPAPHTAAELRAWGRQTRRAILDEPAGGRHILGIVFYKLTWDGEAVDLMSPDRQAATGFSRTFNTDLENALKAAGWPLGRDWLREDLRVCIGDEQKIFVQTAGGEVIP